MDKQSKETIASADDAELTVFVRAFQELEPSELDLVAGGVGTCIIPMGG
ncbi:MAG TPA: hypothetical protein VF605_10170 [Allosphingosinicella sp.]|jgi:hypothetical protein